MYHPPGTLVCVNQALCPDFLLGFHYRGMIEPWPWDWTLSGRSLDWYQVAQSLHSNHMADLSTIGSAQYWNYLGYLSISKILLSLGKFQGFREVLSQGARTKASQNLYYRTPTLNGTRWGGGKEFWEPKFHLSEADPVPNHHNSIMSDTLAPHQEYTFSMPSLSSLLLPHHKHTDHLQSFITITWILVSDCH